jgi:hypothetical protein
MKVHNETHLNCVVVSTKDNYNGLLQMADKPKLYLGLALVDNHNVAHDHIVKQTWEVIKVLQKESRTNAVGELKEAVSKGTVITDLQEIYQAAKEGRGDLLAVSQDFEQPVLMTSDKSFKIVNDVTLPNVIDDITSNLAWEVLSKKGRVVFLDGDQLQGLGNIALKTRY